MQTHSVTFDLLLTIDCFSHIDQNLEPSDGIFSFNSHLTLSYLDFWKCMVTQGRGGGFKVPVARKMAKTVEIAKKKQLSVSRHRIMGLESKR